MVEASTASGVAASRLPDWEMPEIIPDIVPNLSGPSHRAAVKKALMKIAAQPIPIRKRAAAALHSEVDRPNSAVPTTAMTSRPVTVRRGPMLSSSSPVGIWPMA